MKKPKYYLKPWTKGEVHRDYIRKKNWNDLRKANAKPEANFDPFSRIKWYRVIEHYLGETITWHIREEYLTQRLFIEQREQEKQKTTTET